MLKFVCFLIISACGTFAGLEFRRKMTVRIKSLMMFREVFREMKSMISYSGLAVHEIINELEHAHSDNKFISKCSEKTHHCSFKTAWQMSVEELSCELALNKDDEVFLCQSAEKIGKSDIENELELLDMICTKLDSMIEEANGKLNTDGKIYTAIGSSCGIITALILI